MAEEVTVAAAAGPESGRVLDDLPDESRLWRLVDKTATCWLWTGRSTGRGYGTYSYRAGPRVRAVLVHRWSYTLANGPIPPRATIDHLCRVKRCVRPDHLEAVSAGTNVLRGNTITALNAAKTHCAQGHDFALTAVAAKNGQRYCRECRRAADRRRYHRDPAAANRRRAAQRTRERERVSQV